MKKLYTAIICIALLSLILCPASLAAETDLGDLGSELVSDGESLIEDAVTDIKDMTDDSEGFLDPENGEPEAEEDGIVDDDNGNDTTEKATEKADSDTADESTGVIEGMELEENGINPWAIAIAVIIIISVLVLIFILIPKRG